MRSLKFVVNAQQISKDPECDFSGLVAGTKNYLKAYFTFSEEWKECKLAVSFWRGRKEYAYSLENGSCIIPPEVLTGATFSISVTGQKGNYRITTNRVTVRQEVSR